MNALSLVSALGQQALYGALAALAVWTLSAALREKAPQLRFALWNLVLLRFLLPPDLTAPWSLRQLAARWPATATAAPEAAPRAAGSENAGGDLLSGLPSADPLWAKLLLTVWFFGAFVLLARWGVAAWSLHRRLARAPSIASPPLLEMVDAWRRRLGIRRRIRLVTGEESAAPFTAGVLRPVVFLPQPIAEGWRPERVEPVLVHEIVHVRRLDSLWMHLESLLAAIFFFHPGLWLAVRKIRLLREELCDLKTLDTGAVSPERYGGALLSVIRLDLESTRSGFPTFTPAFGHDSRRLRMRIEKILAFRRSRPSVIPWLAAFLLGVLILPMASAGDALAADEEPAGGGTPELSHPLAAGRLTSSFGQRRDPVSGKKVFHTGADLAAPGGTPVVAPAAGTVKVATDSYSGGQRFGTVLVLDHGSGVETRYAHLHRLLVGPGESIEQGQAVAEVGNSGVSTGPHLHFEVWIDGEARDPASLVAGWARDAP